MQGRIGGSLYKPIARTASSSAGDFRLQMKYFFCGRLALSATLLGNQVAKNRKDAAGRNRGNVNEGKGI
jgi:hypothetical protein